MKKMTYVLIFLMCNHLYAANFLSEVHKQNHNKCLEMVGLIDWRNIADEVSGQLIQTFIFNECNAKGLAQHFKTYKKLCEKPNQLTCLTDYLNLLLEDDISYGFFLGAYLDVLVLLSSNNQNLVLNLIDFQIYSLEKAQVNFRIESEMRNKLTDDNRQKVDELLSLFRHEIPLRNQQDYLTLLISEKSPLYNFIKKKDKPFTIMMKTASELLVRDSINNMTLKWLNESFSYEINENIKDIPGDRRDLYIKKLNEIKNLYKINVGYINFFNKLSDVPLKTAADVAEKKIDTTEKLEVDYTIDREKIITEALKEATSVNDKNLTTQMNSCMKGANFFNCYKLYEISLAKKLPNLITYSKISVCSTSSINRCESLVFNSYKEKEYFVMIALKSSKKQSVKNCNDGNKVSCFSFAQAVEKHLGRAAAKEHYEKACMMGFKTACQ